MFLGLPDPAPCPLIKGMDLDPDPDPALDPSLLLKGVEWTEIMLAK
jgi:hypothetical protein